MRVSLELVDVYRYEGLPGTRFRFRVKGTKIYINVTASSLEEAASKVERIVKSLELNKYLESKISEGGERRP